MTSPFVAFQELLKLKIFPICSYSTLCDLFRIWLDYSGILLAHRRSPTLPADGLNFDPSNVAKRQTGLSEEAVGGLPVAFHMNCLKEQSWRQKKKRLKCLESEIVCFALWNCFVVVMSMIQASIMAWLCVRTTLPLHTAPTVLWYYDMVV